MMRTTVSLLALVALAADADAEDLRDPKSPPPTRGEEARPPSRDARRAQTIERARQEIEKNPSQKKFILFRYGITEGDLR